MKPVELLPGREYQWPTVKLDDWYDRLGPGHYELSVRKRLFGTANGCNQIRCFSMSFRERNLTAMRPAVQFRPSGI